MSDDQDEQRERLRERLREQHRADMKDLVAFVRARLDEDEAVARAAQRGEASVEDDPCPPAMAGYVAFDPARVLRAVHAKRRVVEVLEAVGEGRPGPLFSLLQPVATVYADHPDYRVEWLQDTYGVLFGDQQALLRLGPT